MFIVIQATRIDRLIFINIHHNNNRQNPLKFQLYYDGRCKALRNVDVSIPCGPCGEGERPPLGIPEST